MDIWKTRYERMCITIFLYAALIYILLKSKISVSFWCEYNVHCLKFQILCLNCFDAGGVLCNLCPYFLLFDFPSASLLRCYILILSGVNEVVWCIKLAVSKMYLTCIYEFILRTGWGIEGIPTVELQREILAGKKAEGDVDTVHDECKDRNFLSVSINSRDHGGHC